jgi:hypothetical protein
LAMRTWRASGRTGSTSRARPRRRGCVFELITSVSCCLDCLRSNPPRLLERWVDSIRICQDLLSRHRLAGCTTTTTPSPHPACAAGLLHGREPDHAADEQELGAADDARVLVRQVLRAVVHSLHHVVGRLQGGRPRARRRDRVWRSQLRRRAGPTGTPFILPGQRGIGIRPVCLFSAISWRESQRRM